MSKLKAFLAKNTIKVADGLPVVHSTRAYNLGQLRQSNMLQVTECDVFKTEELNYFFVGRPAYKLDSDGQGSPWEYPCCFIFDIKVLSDIRRIFPFDSGAFAGGRYPSYIQRMPLEEFTAETSTETPGKIIGAFFGSPWNYFRSKPVNEDDFISEHNLGAFDAEVRGLHRLSGDSGSDKFDDRRMTIEIQNGSPIDLVADNPLAVIAPSEYFDDADFRKQVTETWGAEPISYPVHTLSVQGAYSSIYDRVLDFYQRNGLLP
ncbi:hypothetical protein MMA231_02533 [Asticcacaulis sp. MM231]|uniref:hypothetical protein n=1 Tax=Asticcacaulis sp. MM231 TaxID=3157666 RepID=UPI0032D57FD2